jgi:hypothetical protein
MMQSQLADAQSALSVGAVARDVAPPLRRRSRGGLAGGRRPRLMRGTSSSVEISSRRHVHCLASVARETAARRRCGIRQITTSDCRWRPRMHRAAAVGPHARRRPSCALGSLACRSQDPAAQSSPLGARCCHAGSGAGAHGRDARRAHATRAAALRGKHVRKPASGMASEERARRAAARALARTPAELAVLRVHVVVELVRVFGVVCRAIRVMRSRTEAVRAARAGGGAGRRIRLRARRAR